MDLVFTDSEGRTLKPEVELQPNMLSIKTPFGDTVILWENELAPNWVLYDQGRGE